MYILLNVWHKGIQLLTKVVRLLYFQKGECEKQNQTGIFQFIGIFF